MYKKEKTQRGITLIALVITIIVMLILVGVTISMTVDGGLLNFAGSAASKTESKKEEEFNLSKGDIVDYYLDQINSRNKELNPSGTIPEGATYKTGYVYNEDEYYWDDSNVETLIAGQTFPETSEVGDIYAYGDYEYCYGWAWCPDGCGEWSHICSCGYAVTEGWAARYVNDEEKPGPILESINNVSLKSLSGTFHNCTLLTDINGFVIPKTVTKMIRTFSYTGLTKISELVIPNSVMDMEGAFSYTGLTDISELAIPNSVTNLTGTFFECIGLSGIITINANPTDYTYCFENVDMSKITLAGSSTMKQTLANTGKNANQVTIVD